MTHRGWILLAITIVILGGLALWGWLRPTPPIVVEPTEAFMAAALPPVTPTPEELVVEPTATAVVVQNDLTAPNLFDADSCPPEENPGGCSLDVGVNPGQIGLVFGWHIAWPKGKLDAGGEGCDLVILTPGWYENLLVLDGRYEVYDVPSADYPGWVEVLGQQRAEEQASHYGCPSKSFEDIPQWESSFPSPPD